MTVRTRPTQLVERRVSGGNIHAQDQSLDEKSDESLERRVLSVPAIGEPTTMSATPMRRDSRIANAAKNVMNGVAPSRLLKSVIASASARGNRRACTRPRALASRLPSVGNSASVRSASCAFQNARWRSRAALEAGFLSSVVGVLQRQRGQDRRRAGDELVVERRQFGKQHAPRPCVTRDVVYRDEQDVLVGAEKVPQSRSEQRYPGKNEWALNLGGSIWRFASSTRDRLRRRS